LKLSSSKISFYCALLTCILGAQVIVGKYVNAIDMLHVRPSMIAMPFYEAFGFLLSGLALVFLNYQRLQQVKFLGLAVLTIGIFSLSVKILNVDVNSLSLDPFFPDNNSYPEKINFNTALCFILSGYTFFSQSADRTIKKGFLVSGMLGVSILALGSIGFFTALIDLNPEKGIGLLTRMAIHTPAGFGLLGLGLVAFSWKNEQKKVFFSPPWLPFLILIGITTSTFCLWIHIKDQVQLYLSTAIIVFGMVMGLLLSFAVYFLQREHRLVGQIDKSNKTLELEINERKQIEEKLNTSKEELRNLNSRLQKVREEEKLNIAREVHDELGQVLTALKIELSLLEEELSEENKGLGVKIHSMGELIDKTVQTVQRICLELRPQILDNFGFPEAIQWQAEEFEIRTGIRCNVSLPKDTFALDQERSTAYIRVLQEALTNVARHAKASEVQVRLMKYENSVTLDINDNGKGIQSNKISDPNSLGLLGIRERILLLKGQFKISGSPDKGTHLSFAIPIQNHG
jgi:signal transduction histidine kinase